MAKQVLLIESTARIHGTHSDQLGNHLRSRDDVGSIHGLSLSLSRLSACVTPHDLRSTCNMELASDLSYSRNSLNPRARPSNAPPLHECCLECYIS